MSLQGPARPGCVRRGLSSVAHLRRPCILFFLAMTTSWPGSALANCHIFRIWHYNKPQRCFAYAYVPKIAFHVKRDAGDADFGRKPASRVPETFQQRIDILIPSIDFVACPEGDERLQGIAKLHALYDAPRP